MCLCCNSTSQATKLSLNCHVKGKKNQGGRRYFCRREITALVGGPGNTAVYRHISVVPPTAKVVTAEKRKPPTANTVPPYCITAEKYRHILILPLPPKNTAKRVPPTLDTAQKVPSTLDTVQKVPVFSCSFFVLCFSWFFGFLFGRTSLWTCGQRDAPAPAHAPAPTPVHTTLSVVQQNTERFRGESQCC